MAFHKQNFEIPIEISSKVLKCPEKEFLRTCGMVFPVRRFFRSQKPLEII